MRNFVFGYIATAVLILVLVSALGIYGLGSRKNELNHQLAVAVEQTLKENFRDTSVSTGMVHDQLQNRLEQVLDSDSDIQVEILGWDAGKGLLSVRATNTFPYPGGRSGKICLEKTAIVDRKVE